MYGALPNNTQETEAQVNNVDVLQALTSEAVKDKEAMANLASINITLYQSLTKAQETMLVLSKQLKVLQVQTKTKTPDTKITALDKSPRILNWSDTAGLMGEPANLTIPAQT